MYKAKIIHNIPIEKAALDEIQGEIPIYLETVLSTKKIETKYNPYFLEKWGDFDWLRSLFHKKWDVRCFITSQKQLKEAGVVKHIGMYDLLDNDGVLDFYAGLPEKLDRRASRNGFKSNLAWMFCHEYLHGREQGGPDRVHAMEKQGRLKELLAEYRKKDLQRSAFNLLQSIKNLLLAIQKKIL